MSSGITFKEHKILMVDDEKEYLENMLTNLKHDFSILTAFKASDAREILEKESIAVILSDQKMPDILGTDLLIEVKEKYPDTIRVLITGYTDLGAAIDAINKGDIYRYIPKTASVPEIEGLIKQSIERYYLRKEKNKLYNANQRLLKQLATQEKISAVGYFGTVLHDMFQPLLQQLGHDLAQEDLMKYSCGDDCARPKETKVLMEKVAKSILTLKEVTSSEFFIKPLKEDVPTPQKDANLNGIIKNIVDYYVPKYTVPDEEKKKYNFDLKLANDLPQLALDVDKIDYAIERVILNSVQSREDVTITIKTKLKKEEKKEYVVLEISDDGIGIPKENLEKIRTPFFTTKPGHTGLGLTIAENIFNKHEATLDVKNNLLKGTTVTVTFPINEKSTAK
ncbi:MAG: ATP-binding protein [bacterium]